MGKMEQQIKASGRKLGLGIEKYTYVNFWQFQQRQTIYKSCFESFQHLAE